MYKSWRGFRKFQRNISSLKHSVPTFTGLNKGTYERNSLGWYKSHSLSHIGSGSRDIRTVHVSMAICYNEVKNVPHSESLYCQ
jgi:hypothetical protein